MIAARLYAALCIKRERTAQVTWGGEIMEEALPLGLGMALAQHPEAMQRFASLPEAERQAIAAGAHQVHSKEEMRAYVERLAR